MTVRAERVVLTTELPGRTAAYLVAEVRPQVNGIIQRADVRGGLRREGRRAPLPDRPGPLPGGLRPGQGRARRGRGDASRRARSRAERLKGLVEIRAVGQQDYDDAARRAAAGRGRRRARRRAAVESARINLAYTPLKAPISGRTGKSLGDGGRARHRLPADAARHDPAARPDLRRRHAVERRPPAPAPEPARAAS